MTKITTYAQTWFQFHDGKFTPVVCPTGDHVWSEVAEGWGYAYVKRGRPSHPFHMSDANLYIKVKDSDKWPFAFVSEIELGSFDHQGIEASVTLYVCVFSALDLIAMAKELNPLMDMFTVRLYA